MSALPPGARIGIMGGGQLGRMLALAAAQLGFDVHVFTPEADSPAARVAAAATIASFEDAAALARFARGVDVVTFEFENVPAAAAAALVENGALIRPGAEALRVAQDRLVEKTFLNACGVATVGFEAIEGPGDIAGALERLGAPALLKTRRLGYDGKGQVWVAAADEAEAAWAAIGRAPAILEAKAGFAYEASILAARGVDGEIACYELSQNEHEGGILRRSFAPSVAGAQVRAEAERAVRALLERLDYVGLLALELFVTPEGRVLGNEFAPRVHNSGHWTPEACLTGQFEQHIRAVAGWPLGSPARVAEAVMMNLLGDDASKWRDWAQDRSARLHLYGKREAKAGRKMGHVVQLRHGLARDDADRGG